MKSLVITEKPSVAADLARALGNLAQLRKIGFGANRRLLGVQTAARDALHSEAAFRHVHEPFETPQGQKIAGLLFGDLRMHQLLQALIVLSVLPGDFRARQLRAILGWLIYSRQDHL